MATKIQIIGNDEHRTDQEIKLPNDNPDGFHGEIVLKFVRGKLTSATCPRESLHIKTLKS